MHEKTGLQKLLWRTLTAGSLFGSALLCPVSLSLSYGQDGGVPVTAPGATPPGAVPGTAVPGSLVPGTPMPGVANPAAVTPGTDGQPAGTPGSPMPPAATAVKPISRADRPAASANPEELKTQPDAKGLVRFNFQGQPWLEVLEWLARISHLSLDWQELPGDHLNLATQRGYTVTEARDLINRHLLDRGYTLLRNGEVLTVVNIKKIDPALVPRVRPADLAKRDPHEFVKVSFTLDWLLAEKAVEELKPMLSQNGRLTALKSTNRVEAMDAVTNLLEIYEVIQEEQSRDGKEQLVQEFALKNARAADVDRMLRALMGMQKNQDGEHGGGGGSPSPDQFMAIQQQLQQMQQMQQQAAQQAQPGVPGGPQKEIYIVVNAKRNSLLVQAPADKMAVITQAIQHLDVGNDEPGSLMHAINSTKIYRLSEIDPASLAKTLEELGNLDPMTRIKVDGKNRSLIVTGALADHVIIAELIKKLDGTDRKFEVIRLRRLPADYVAGTIEFMMGVNKKDENEGMNPFMAYQFGMAFGGGTDKKPDGKFRVSADTENNRLLLWTNDIELKEVQNLLVKLGEMPSKDGNQDRVRVIEAGNPQAAKRLADQLQKTRPEFKIEIQEEPIPQDPAEPQEPAKLERLVPPTTSTTAPRATRQARAAQTRSPLSAKPSTKRSDTESRGGQVSVSETQTRAAGQGGRILKAGKAIPNVSLVRLDRDVAEQVSETPPPEIDSNRGAEQNQPVRKPPLRRLSEELGTDSPEPVRRKPFTTPSAVGTDVTNSEESVDQDPIQFIVTADGQLIISSPDTRALDELEDTVSQIAPPRRDFKIFHLKNKSTWPTGVVWNLEKYFGTEKDKNGGGLKYSPYWGIYPSEKKSDGPNSLSKRRIPKFIADSDSQTILVTGADPEQLRIIQELIDIYDRPDTSENKALRLTKIFQLKHSKARIVADAVKEVYRDLLSANDPALQQANQNKDQKPSPAERQYTYIYGGGGSDEKDKDKEPEAPIKFKGLLSLGVDDISNTVIVSAQEGLLENIGQMIDSLDMAAKPTENTIDVIHVGRHLEASGLQERLSKLLTRPQPQQPQPGQPQQPGQQPGQPGNPNPVQQQPAAENPQ